MQTTPKKNWDKSSEKDNRRCNTKEHIFYGQGNNTDIIYGSYL